MNSRQRFLAACNRQSLERPPIWVMRQAGRHLPEYLELKKQYNFLQMVQTPELAAQVTLQPIQRYGMDAAIIFSDILVIPEAMGQPYAFRDGGGIEMSRKLHGENDIDSLTTTGIDEHLQYVGDAIRLVRKELGEETAIIGFGGAPWTLATYMIEGGSSKNFAKAKELFFTNQKVFAKLMDKLCETLINYFQLQIDAGVDAIQIFDSWAGALTHYSFWEASGKYIARIVEHFKGKLPIIAFAKGAHLWQEDLHKINADVLGVDSPIPLSSFYDSLDGKYAVQGNMDPILLNTTPEIVRQETLRILEDFGTRSGHIFNLGHGILPQAKIECVTALVETVKNFNSKNDG